MLNYDERSSKGVGSTGSTPTVALGPGKQTLVGQIDVPAIQCKSADAEAVQTSAARGTATPSRPLPYADQIQRAFGAHDISSIQAHTGPEASASASAMGAEAYATGNHVVLGGGTDLHTVAHEAAHVVQQRGGAQLKGGIGAAGDAYERHADAVADRVVAGQSAEDLLGAGATGPAGHAVQRKERAGDAQILENQASLKNVDVEIPALEGALLATRMEAVKQGLLSKASFDAGLALSQAMTRLQPAVAAHGHVDGLLQQTAAGAAHQLFAALRRETAEDRNFQPQPTTDDGGSVTSLNPYTEELRVSTSFLIWSSEHTGSWLEQLPSLIREARWGEAFTGYRRLLDGLDLWVADQLRRKGKGTPEEARGNAHQHFSQLRTGLEQIADRHATRLPALFHPSAQPVGAVPMNVYFWKDEKDGKHHLYDLTTPSRPHEQALEGAPTAAAIATFFEDVARYPEGEVRYTLPGGGAGVAPTTGKTKWYEWVGYAGLALAGIGLALLSGGASVLATYCFAAGALAGGVSASGHLADTLRLGSATTATIVLDVAQVAASFASAGAMNIAIKTGGAAAALANSRWFVPLVGATAAADAVQLVALTDITYVELAKIQGGAGTPEDKQRAMAVLFTQLIVTGGLTVLSVQGARNARALSGQSLELVEQNGRQVLRLAGDDPSLSTPHPERPPELSGHDPATTELKPAAEHQSRSEHPAARETGAGGSRDPARDTSALPSSWDKFEPSSNEAFRARLKAFRGNGNCNPDYAGGEGRVFAADGQLIALKRWFKSRLADMPASLAKLRQVRVEVESSPKLSADIDVVKIHEEGPDWILRDFDPNSVELKAGPAEAQAARARAISELEARRANGGLSAMLADLLKKLRKIPPSANLHWSPSKAKIVVIDMQ